MKKIINPITTAITIILILLGFAFTSGALVELVFHFVLNIPTPSPIIVTYYILLVGILLLCIALSLIRLQNREPKETT